MTSSVPPPPPTVVVPAGWYSNGAMQRYWDGSAWTEHTAPAPNAGGAPPAAAAAPVQQAGAYAGAPIMAFASHIAGKNAQVRIFPDRVEWTKAGMMGQKGAEMVPMRSISSVSLRKDGMINTVVQVATSGGLIEMRVGHALAQQVRACLTSQMLG